MWTRVSYYSADQDSQMVAEEAMMPGARYLGVAKADHWALALPFTEAGHTRVDHNKFPRTALLEALVRYVYKTP